ncbi:MAG TPA: hypothetical protein VD866_16520 [Urbifossiella sp.]|nr:hypothetical protein [Urbifossiella sp.]
MLALTLALSLTTPTPDVPAAVQVTGLAPRDLVAVRDAKLPPERWPAVLRVVVVGGTPAEEAARPAVAGSYTVTDKAIRFTPEFAFVPGVSYRATFDPAPLKLGGRPVSALLSLPKPPPGPRVSVVALSPSADRLPENTLRFYIQFSGPVARGDVYRFLRLVRDDGREVESPFLEIGEELWSADGLRLTVLFHPGRIKQGLIPRMELGPILEAGRRYTFVISGDWKDAEGRPLVAEYRRTFLATAADDEPVDPDSWTLIPPRPGGPLILRLPEPLDRALLESTVWVEDESGKRVEGVTTVGGGERVVTVEPSRPWRAGRYRLVVDTRLEDVCGNRVGEPFEVDVFRPVQRRIETKTVSRPFEVR